MMTHKEQLNTNAFGGVGHKKLDKKEEHFIFIFYLRPDKNSVKSACV